MAFPATGMEAAYRNDGNQVANLFKEKHPSHFCVYNLTERKYDTTMFEGRVRFSPLAAPQHRKFFIGPYFPLPFGLAFIPSIVSFVFYDSILDI